jgi:NAD-dependent DNA ligase (contains BRCT domain type II)
MNKKLFVATVALLVGSAFGAAPALAAENPIDQAGIRHNMYLGCLMEAKASPDEALAVLVQTCGYNPGMPLERFIATHQPIVDAVDPTRPMTENLAGLRQQLSAYEFSFIVRMDQIVEGAREMDAAATQFEELEREGIALLDPKSRNGALVLGALSVVRHSARYWSTHAAGITSKKTASPGSGWLIVAACDAVGYLAFGNSELAASTSYAAFNILVSEGYFPLYADR